MMKRLLFVLMICAAIVIGARFDSFIERPATVLAQTNTFCAANLACTVTAAWTYSGGLTSTNTNNIIHVGGNTGQTLAQGLALCPAGTAGCHIVIDGNLTFTNPIVITAGSGPNTLELECANPSAANGNAGGTTLTYTPSTAPSVGITLQSVAGFQFHGCNYTQGNVLDGTTVALTNIVGNGTTATATCTASCQSALTNAVQGSTGGVIVSITGNTNAGFNNPFAVLSFPTVSTFTFASQVNATGTGGNAIVGVTGLLCQGCQKSTISGTQVFGFTGVQYQITDSLTSSGEYNLMIGSHLRGGRVTLADNIIGYSVGKSANENRFIETSAGGGSVRAVLTTGGASEVGFHGGEVSDATPGSEPIIMQFGDGINSCRDNDLISVTNESPGTAPANQIAILNGCQASMLKFEGGLGGTTPLMDIDIGTASAPAGFTTNTIGAGHFGIKGSGVGSPANSYIDITLPNFKLDSAGNCAFGSAAIVSGGGPNCNGLNGLLTGGNATLSFSSTLVAIGTPITAFYPSNNSVTTLGRSGNGWGSQWMTETTAPSGAASQDVCYGDSTAHALKCNYNNATNFLSMQQVVSTSFTTTAATTDNVTVTGMTSTGHCYLTATNSGAAGGIASVFISAKTTNQITVTHTATSGWTFDVVCTPQ